eukprot:tig00020564_g11421.t1
MLNAIGTHWRLLGSGAAAEVKHMLKVPRLPPELDRDRRREGNRERERDRASPPTRSRREEEDAKRDRYEVSGWSERPIRYENGPPPAKRPREGPGPSGSPTPMAGPSAAPVVIESREAYVARLAEAGIRDPKQQNDLYEKYAAHCRQAAAAAGSSSAGTPSLVTATPSTEAGAGPPAPGGLSSSTAELLRKQKKKEDEDKRHKQLLKLCLQFNVKHDSLAAFRTSLASVIAKVLSPYLKEGKICSKEDFKHLCRKMTHTIVEKEIKRHGEKGRLEFRDSVEKNAKSYVQHYFEKHGKYVRKAGDKDEDGGDA